MTSLMNNMSSKSFAAKEYEMRRELSRSKDELREMSEKLKKLEGELKQKENIIQILYSQIDDMSNGEDINPLKQELEELSNETEEELEDVEYIEEELEDYVDGEEYEYVDDVEEDANAN